MSIRYNSEWYAPAIGPDDQIDKFWKQTILPIKYIGNDKCIYVFESVGDDLDIIQTSLDFPDIVFYGLIHSKIDFTQWWTNVIVKNGDYIITNEVPGDDWDSAWCNGLSVLFPETGYVIPDCYKHLYVKMPEDQKDVPLPEPAQNDGIYF